MGRFLTRHRNMLGGDMNGIFDPREIYELSEGMRTANRKIPMAKTGKNYGSRHKNENTVEEPLLPKQPDLAALTTQPLMHKAPDDIEALARLAGN